MAETPGSPQNYIDWAAREAELDSSRLQAIDWTFREFEMAETQPQPVEWAVREQELAETSIVPIEERCLTEVDHLNNNRRPDGSHDRFTLKEIYKNLLSATKEAAMPYAVTKTEHEYAATGEHGANGEVIKSYMWLGKTAVRHAMSGLRFHNHPEALKRVGVEIDEARDAEANLRPGVTKVFISPRMTRVDATLKEARIEHLAYDDAVRISDVEADETGNITKRKLESLLVRDVPLEAWVSMLADPDNIFGKSITVEDNGSALPVMQAHRELEVPSGSLQHGVISVVEAVIPYITDATVRSNVQQQIERFNRGQENMDEQAHFAAQRWQEFEVELADSLHERRATPQIEQFIKQHSMQWNDEDLEIINDHLGEDGGYIMSRELAVVVERGRQNLLLVSAAVMTGNEKVMRQLDPSVVRQIRVDEELIQMAYANGMRHQVAALEVQQRQKIADQNVGVGGGCSTIANPNFRDTVLGDGGNSAAAEAGEVGASRWRGWGGGSGEKKRWRLAKSECVVSGCPTRPKQVTVGPCGVCMDRCQRVYDTGGDPTAAPKRTRAQSVARKPVSIGEQSHSSESSQHHREKQAGAAVVRAHTSMNATRPRGDHAGHTNSVASHHSQIAAAVPNAATASPSPQSAAAPRELAHA